MVVPSVNGLTCLRDCLAALHAQRGGFQLEILVPERCGAAVQNAMAGRFPQVRVLPVPPSTGIPTMRRMGFDHATAPSVAVVEDHVIVPPDWASALLEARSDGHAVVGGSVVNGATDTRVDRLAFLCEYGHLLAPIRRGTCSSVTGNNVVYDREVLERFRKVVAEDRWEGHLHDAMRDAGIELRCRPEIRVSHRMHYPRARDYAAQRFLFSRSYAGMWAASRGMGARLLRALGSLLLPAVLLVRIVRRGWTRPDLRRDVLEGLPLLAFFAAAWGFGEAVGAAFGPGDALQRVC